VWPPIQAVDGAAPARPNFDQLDYHYPERALIRLVEAALSTAAGRNPNDERFPSTRLVPIGGDGTAS
jgi:hypothetical protein